MPNGTITVGTGTSGTRFVNKNYPVVEGLTAGTTKLSKDPDLVAEQGSIVSKNENVGLS